MTDNIARTIHEVSFKKALSERYLSYALSTITSRSLPDVRDGLKPVHRRLLFAMLELKLNPEQGFKKCSRIVGDVMGKYHPHGDSAIYDAMVRMAQSFSVRYPLVDGQGNFGNIDGDNAAAMRYTEARLTAFAQEMLKGIDNNTVDFRETYDGEGAEPVVLPSLVPNLLANGSSGIAVGMATNIPPHNVGEICSALLYMIKTPDASIEKIMTFIKGPDFPTGGVLCENAENIREIYTVGRGSMRIRARWEKEELPKGLWQIVITEIPYQVQKSKLIEKIAEIIETKKIPLISDIRDESAEDVRIVIEPKSRNVDADTLMEALFKYSDLETRFSLNMNVLCKKGRVPKVLSIKQVLQEYLEHREEIVYRRLNNRKQQIDRRLEILQGYLKAYLNLDEVIKIIRFDDHPRQKLIEKFTLTEIQADAILNMRLRSLRKLEETEIQNEHDTLQKELDEILNLLKNIDGRWSIVAEEIKQTKKQYGTSTVLGKRFTTISDAPTMIDIPLESMIEKEPITIVCSANKWIRGLKGHVASKDDVKYKEGDSEHFVIKAQTTDKILLLTSSGKFFTLEASKIPGGRGHGEPITIHLDMNQGDSIVEMFVYQPDTKILLASSDGRGFIVTQESLLAQTRNGKQVLSVMTPVVAKLCRPVVGDSVAIIGNNRKLLIFPLDEIPEMHRGKGVILQKYKDSTLEDILVFNADDGLTWSSGENRIRTEKDIIGWLGKRASLGKIPPVGFAKNNKFRT